MINRLLSRISLAGGLGLIALSPLLTPAALAQNTPHEQAMAADDFTLWNDGEMNGIAFDVWTRSAASGGGFYYFLWEGNYENIADHGSPEVVVFFESNIAQVNTNLLTDCFRDGSYSDTCWKPERKPTHYRYTGQCIFPWQTAYGSTCGSAASIPRPGAF